MPPLIPRAKRGGNKRTVDVREIVNGIMYIPRFEWCRMTSVSSVSGMILNYATVVYSISLRNVRSGKPSTRMKAAVMTTPLSRKQPVSAVR